MRGARLGLLALAVPLVCCGAPFLLAALVATGAGAWLAANRLVLGSAAALVVAAVALGFWIQQRRGMR